MSSPHLAIAKASFAASLLRPDITKVNRDDLPAFHSSLEEAVMRCSPRNIQNCKPFLIENVLPSHQRTAAFGKYLTSLSTHLAAVPSGGDNVRHVHRQRLHVLYILNDILHHAKYHAQGLSSSQSVADALRPILVGLFQLASDDTRNRVKSRLGQLAQLWRTEEYLTDELYTNIHERLQHGEAAGQGVDKTPSAPTAKELPYIMPPCHGDPTTPFYDLPAGNFMPHIMPNSSAPMQVNQISALQFSAGPADEGLVNALKDFLKDVETIDKPFARFDDEETSAEFDEMGQILHREETGAFIGDTYYGWSRAFCQKMKRRRQSERHGTRDRLESSSRSRSHSRSRSRSRSRPRRLRYDSTESRSSSNSHTRTGSDVARRGLGRSPSNEPTQPEIGRFPPMQPRFTHGNFDHQPGLGSSSSVFHLGTPLSIQSASYLDGSRGAALPPRPPTLDSSTPWPPPPPPLSLSIQNLQNLGARSSMSFPPPAPASSAPRSLGEGNQRNGYR